MPLQAPPSPEAIIAACTLLSYTAGTLEGYNLLRNSNTAVTSGYDDDDDIKRKVESNRRPSVIMAIPKSFVYSTLALPTTLLLGASPGPYVMQYLHPESLVLGRQHIR